MLRQRKKRLLTTALSLAAVTGPGFVDTQSAMAQDHGQSYGSPGGGGSQFIIGPPGPASDVRGPRGPRGSSGCSG